MPTEKKKEVKKTTALLHCLPPPPAQGEPCVTAALRATWYQPAGSGSGSDHCAKVDQSHPTLTRADLSQSVVPAPLPLTEGIWVYKGSASLSPSDVLTETRRHVPWLVLHRLWTNPVVLAAA